MTQRVARPMKFAAFISIIISLVVLFAACQAGPAGPLGADGQDGQDGVDGSDGQDGTDGFTALQLKGSGALIIINNDDMDGHGDAKTEDLDTHVRGSARPLMWAEEAPAGGENATDAIFDTKMDGSMLTVSVSVGDADVPDGTQDETYSLQNFTVMVEDTDGATETVPIRARRNRAPTVSASIPPFEVGTQATAHDAAIEVTPDVLTCAAYNECTRTLQVDDVDGNGEVSDDSADHDGITVSGTSESDAIEVSTSADGKSLVVKGLKTTNDGDAQTIDDGATIEITVTDGGDLTATGMIVVTVDAGPEVQAVLGDRTVDQGQTGVVLYSNLDNFFNDPDAADDTLVYLVTVAEDDVHIAEVDTTGGVGDDDVTIIPRNPGSATITVRATEGAQDGLGQYVEQTFTLTVE